MGKSQEENGGIGVDHFPKRSAPPEIAADIDTSDLGGCNGLKSSQYDRATLRNERHISFAPFGKCISCKYKNYGPRLSQIFCGRGMGKLTGLRVIVTLEATSDLLCLYQATRLVMNGSF